MVEMRRLNVAVLGISTDDVNSHGEFAQKYHLPFPLLSDSGGAVARAYGSLMGLGPFRFAKRRTFIVRPGGKVAKIYRKVHPKTHSQQVITDLRALGAGVSTKERQKL
jgi:peroxiredoxin Q/BCP